MLDVDFVFCFNSPKMMFFVLSLPIPGRFSFLDSSSGSSLFSISKTKSSISFRPIPTYPPPRFLDLVPINGGDLGIVLAIVALLATDLEVTFGHVKSSVRG